MTAPQVAYKLGTTRQGVQKQLNLLLEAEHVEKRPNAAHKRSPFYGLTPTGQTLFLNINTRWEKQASEWAAAFSSQQIDQTERAIAQFIRIIQQESS